MDKRSSCGQVLTLVPPNLASPRVKVLAKAAKLLQILADNPGLTAPLLAQRLGEPRPTVYRLVQDLVALDYVEEGAVQGTYQLGLELFRLGSLGAGPRVLLAFQPREYWDEYFTEVKLAARTPRTPTTKAGIVALLEEARHLGYAISDEDVTVGITSIGAPIFDHKGRVHAALSVGGLRSAVLGHGEERAVKLVAEGAAEISRRMGYKP